MLNHRVLSRCAGDLQIVYYTRPVKLNSIQLGLVFFLLAYDFTSPIYFLCCRR